MDITGEKYIYAKSYLRLVDSQLVYLFLLNLSSLTESKITILNLESRKGRHAVSILFSEGYIIYTDGQAHTYNLFNMSVSANIDY